MHVYTFFNQYKKVIILNETNKIYNNIRNAHTFESISDKYY